MQAVKTILVPTDFSIAAKNALEYAIFIAKGINAKIILLHVYYIPGVSVRTSYMPDLETSVEEYKLAEQRLKDLALAEPSLYTVEYELKTIAAYWNMEFPEIIHTQNADMVIMGTNGATGLKEIIIGSNTANVIEAPVHPVLAIPLQAQFKHIKNIGVAIDLHTIDDLTIFDPLIVLSKLFNADIRIFYIETNTDQYADMVELSSTVKTIRDHFEANTSFDVGFYNSNLADAITEYVSEKEIDILVMTARKRSLFQCLFKNSLTQKISFHSKTPLLVLPESKYKDERI